MTTVRLFTGQRVPIEDTICACGHWHDEHTGPNPRAECQAPDCSCDLFNVDREASTPEAIADRGGDPAYWPEHVKRALPLDDQT